MNFFDTTIIHFLNGFSQKSALFDSMMGFIVDNDFIKGGIIISLFWFFWFRNSGRIAYVRERIIISLVSCIIGIFVGRVLALSLPFRARPVYNAQLGFIKPNKSGQFGLDTWSSFPSDHAIMFFALATGIFLISKKIGVFTYLYVFFIICFPRIYLGLHYPTDILVGAIIGIIITYVVSIEKISRPIIQKVFHFSSKYPGLFYALFFLFSFQICTVFYETRTIGSYLYLILRKLI
jgi:undecaprenyl-diphosphatase